MDEGVGASVIERVIMSAWTEVLRTGTAVGPDDNFFALGGDSIGALNVVFRLEQVFGIEVPPSVLFDSPTPRLLREWLDLQGACPTPTAPPEGGTGESAAGDSGVI
jgi:acyl carrier protein